MSSSGIITSRKCPLCGHHEMGYTTRDGVFHSLKPGTSIQILKDSELSAFSAKDKAAHSGVVGEETNGSEYKVWSPGPVRGDKRFRLKYGVMVKGGVFTNKISGEIYRLAYLEKVQRLIEKEIDTPLAVIMDRFFTAPHLGAGNPRQIAEAMWRELDEIRRPALLVSEWLQTEDEESLVKMIYPNSKEELDDKPLTDEQQRKELEQLTLEEFLGLLQATS